MTQDIIPSLEEEAHSGASMTLTEIYNQLLITPELILVIPADEEERLRKGLASVKAKANKKLVDAGLTPEKTTLTFYVSPAKDDSGEPLEGLISVHIVMGKSNAITVVSLHFPDTEI